MLPESFYIFFAVLFGLIIGSFLNVVIVRLPAQESLVSPPSHCPHCQAPIRWWQNIPVLSFIFLGGKCYNCKKSISWQYPFVEGLTGILFGLSVWYFNPSFQALSACIFIAYLIPIAFIDYRHFLIFDVLSYSGIGMGLLLALLPGQNIGIVSAMIGGGVGAVILLIIRGIGNILFHKESMGFGDVKLAGLIGVFLGWSLTLMSFFLGAVLIVLVYIIKAVFRRRSKPDERYAFGFYFSIAAIGVLFVGGNLLNLYLNFLRPG